MKTVHLILVLVALMSIPAYIGVQQAIGLTTGATGSVTISGQCELGVSSMAFANGSPLTDCASCSDPGVGEKTVTLDNTNGNLQSVTQVKGATWKDSVSTFPDVQSVGSTVFKTTTGTFASKAPLTGTLATLLTVAPASTADTFWDVSIDLDLDANFVGTANQAITFDFACVAVP